MKTLTDYKIILRPDDNGTYVAYIPAIKGCHAWGETLEEARSELNHVFEMIREEDDLLHNSAIAALYETINQLQ